VAIKGNFMFLGPAYGSTQCFGSKTTATGEMVVHVENRFGFVIVILASCSEVACSYFFLKHREVTRVGHEMCGQVGGGVPRKRRPRLSLKARRPWKHEGISRSTWFSRRRKFERYWGEIVGGLRSAWRSAVAVRAATTRIMRLSKRLGSTSPSARGICAATTSIMSRMLVSIAITCSSY